MSSPERYSLFAALGMTELSCREIRRLGDSEGPHTDTERALAECATTLAGLAIYAGYVLIDPESMGDMTPELRAALCMIERRLDGMSLKPHRGN